MDAPEDLIEELPRLAESEREQLLVESNNTRAEYPRDKCIHELFEEQVEQTPDAIAVVCEHEQLTYRELNSRANRLARYLQKLGVGPEALVGICVKRSLEMVVGVLGILKAGGAYVPLDPAYPAPRLSFMSADAGLLVLVTQERQLQSFPEHGTRAVCLDRDREVIAQESSRNPESGVHPENLAYVIYTSGSTGTPKGVAIEHHSTVALVEWTKAVFTDEDLQGVLASTSICFDLSVFELFVTLMRGGKVILASDALQLIELAAAQEVRLINTVPSAISELVRVRGIPDSVRTINLAGETLPQTLVEQLYEQEGIERVFDLYGPSEATTYSTYLLRKKGGVASIGRPISNTQCYILDDLQQMAPFGVAGELYIGGEGLARGYLNRPELTSEKFIPNRFSADPQARLYRTGDWARYLEDGNIEFLGRTDQQVKVRGYRIELGEIETSLAAYPGVDKSVVIAREDQSGSKRLVAYVVPRQKAKLSLTELRGYLKENLPEYMVPSAFMMLDRLPLTPSGKVDRQALPEPDRVRPELEGPFVPPRTPVEEILAVIWCEVLGIEQVGVEDDFFALGGHSLLAAQVIHRISQRCQTHLPLHTLFNAPTVAELAAELGRAGRFGPGVIRRQGIQSAPLSFGQERLWFLDQLNPGSAAYNIPLAARLSTPIDVAALKKSIAEIVRRHEVLRTTVSTVDGQPLSIVSDALDIDFPVIDLSIYPEDEREARARELIKEEALRRFDLTIGPLWRTTLLRLGEQDHVFLVTMHHIVSDGWSMVLFLNELSLLYAAFSRGDQSPIADLPIQYTDYAAWQRDGLGGEVLERQLAYWKGQLGGDLPVLDLRTEKSRRAVQTFRGARKWLVLSETQTESIDALCRGEGVTLFMALLAALKVLLHRYSGQEDIIVGSPIGARPLPETEKLIGYFLNNLALRTDLSGNPTFREVLARVRHTALGGFANQDVSFEKLIEELNPKRDLSRTPFFQVYFNVFNFVEDISLPGTTETIPFIEVWSQSEENFSKFDLTLYAGVHERKLKLAMVYNLDLFDDAFITRILEHFDTLLAGVTADPARAISDFTLIADSRTQHVSTRPHSIRPVNAFVEFKRDEIEQSIPRRFEEQVKKYPAKVAVRSKNYGWSYEELNDAANRIALSILSSDSEDERVALLFEHDAPMIAAMLGVLKAGRTYVPLDPNYPEERLSSILDHSKSTVLLTSNQNLTLARQLTASDMRLVNIDRLESAGCLVDLPAVKPDQIAYILYTSGSTGQPKGVMQNHRNILHFTRVYTNNLHISSDDRLTLLSSYCFDASVMDIYGALLNGATLVPIDLRQDGVASLSEHLRREQITIYHSTPTVYRYFLDTLNDQIEFPELRLVVLGGEEVNRRDVELYQKHFSDGCLFVNGFGPTEATVSLQNFINKQTKASSASVAVGFPVEDTEVLLLNDTGRPAEIHGEIAIKSEHVALGYWRDPEASNAAFAAEPSSNPRQNAVRLYRTGDLGRRLPDGSIKFEGRKDFQVKIRGFRIELGEIESVLAQHSQVAKSVVVARETDDLDKQIVAYVVPHSSQSANEKDLRSFLRQKLPEYMLPASFVMLDSFPLTASGKVDRSALPRPGISPELTKKFVLPRNSTEEIVAKIWRDVLDIDCVGISDNFFELGGHSLKAMQVMSRVSSVFRIDLPLSTIFEAGDVAAIAAIIEDCLINKLEEIPDDEAAQLSCASQP